MSNISLFKSQSCWSYISFIFGRFSSKCFRHKANFVYFSFPSLLLSFSRFHHLKHFTLRKLFDFLDWYVPFSSLLFSLVYNIVYLFYLSMFVSTLELFVYSLSKRYVGTAPSFTSSTLTSTFFSSCAFINFLILTFSLNLSLLKSLAFNPVNCCAFWEISCGSLADFFRALSSVSNLLPNRFWWSSMKSC